MFHFIIGRAGQPPLLWVLGCRCISTHTHPSCPTKNMYMHILQYYIRSSRAAVESRHVCGENLIINYTITTDNNKEIVFIIITTTKSYFHSHCCCRWCKHAVRSMVSMAVSYIYSINLPYQVGEQQQQRRGFRSTVAQPLSHHSSSLYY